MTENKKKITVQDIALIGLMVAVIEVCKAMLSFLPNIELTSFWMIMFALYFGRKVCFVVPVFVLLEGFTYGCGLWWVMYLYAWPIFVITTLLFKRQKSVFFWSILSALFGLFFGMLCAIPYVVIGAVDGGIINGLYAGFTWWIAGIPWDLVHCVGNFVLMLVLYRPISGLMKRLPVCKNTEYKL